MAEASRMWWVLSWAAEQNLGNLILESYTECVVNCILGVTIFAEIVNIIDDCLDLLSKEVVMQ